MENVQNYILKKNYEFYQIFLGFRVLEFAMQNNLKTKTCVFFFFWVNKDPNIYVDLFLIALIDKLIHLKIIRRKLIK